MKIHPAAEIFPMLEGEDFDALVESIRRYGQQVPCVKDGDVLIDGRNRLKACEQLGIDAAFVEYRDVVQPRGEQREGEDKLPLPSEYILAINLERRQLTTDQMATVASKWLPVYRAEAKERMEQGKGADGSGGRCRKKTLVRNGTGVSTPRRSDQAAADAVGVSRRKVRQAAELQQAAPEIFEEVASGKKKLSDAVKEAAPQIAATKKPKKQKPEPTLEERLEKRWQAFIKDIAVTDHGTVREFLNNKLKGTAL